MISISTLLPASLLLAGGLVAAQSENIEAELFKPTRYIVEFSDAGSAKFRKRDGESDTEAFISKLQDGGVSAEPAITFNSELFHGASFEITNATEQAVADILNLPEVGRLWPATYMTLNAESQGFLQDSAALAAWDPHKETNVSQVHTLGHKGEGVVVGIVDTGADYTHPALGGGLGAGFKIDGGWDFIGDSPDVMDCNGHGTHVAGIIGADDKYVQGVAPKATLRPYKVFDCSGGATEDTAMAAFIRAHEEGADVINGSLGADRGFPDSAIALLLSRIQEQGTLIVIAAGNSGAQGPFYTTNLGNNFGGLTIGSIEHETLIAHMVTAYSSSGESRTFAYTSNDGRPFNRTGNVTASWLDADTRTFNPCLQWTAPSPIPDDNLIVLPRNTICSWQSHDNILNNRVDWAFWYNLKDAEYEVPTRLIYDPSVQPVGTALISYEDGDWLVTQHENGYDVTYSFDPDSSPVAAERPSWAGGRLNNWSSWGPTIDGRMKPEVVTPGGTIYNTAAGGGWVTYSGTSMASPYAAGLGALVLGVHGTRQEKSDAAASARRRIIASTRSIKNPDGSGAPASVGQQGAGLVDGLKAVLYSTTVNPSYIQLNDTDNFKSTNEIQITNNGDEQVTYKLSHSTEPTYFPRNAETGLFILSPPHSTESSDLASVELSVEEVTIAAGETVSVEVHFTEPSASDNSTFPIYGGAIVISGNNDETVRVSYLGLKGSINNFPHFGGINPPFQDPDGQAMTEGKTYSFDDQNVPYLPFVIAWSTREFSFDFVGKDWSPEDWAWPLVPGEKNFFGSFRTVGDGDDFVVADFPVVNFPRISRQFHARPSGTFSWGGELVDGEYRYLRRSLKTFGDPNKIEDWQWDLSPWFGVERGA
ncbi:unnamed protein product [Clonostachys byssicola]|uniref:Minor extracellular protease vpr n=1 Tax=Clonostachys byssicola TaxID=160290 RepID=A0A9N9U8Q4_9HYPO|nr:unnamed protein product [Clonostachys byssicola]